MRSNQGCVTTLFSDVEITRPSLAPISTGISSYLLYPLSPGAINSDKFDLRLRFQTSDMEQISLLVFIGQAGQHDSRSQHMALTFVKGYIMLTWNMGTGMYTYKFSGLASHFKGAIDLFFIIS